MDKALAAEKEFDVAEQQKIAAQEAEKKRVAELKEKLNQSSIDYESLDNKYQNLKMAKVIGWAQNSKKIAIDKIRGMVREIDYCISFLKNK